MSQLNKYTKRKIPRHEAVHVSAVYLVSYRPVQRVAVQKSSPSHWHGWTTFVPSPSPMAMSSDTAIKAIESVLAGTLTVHPYPIIEDEAKESYQ